jgi:hypothetical protein
VLDDTQSLLPMPVSQAGREGSLRLTSGESLQSSARLSCRWAQRIECWAFTAGHQRCGQSTGAMADGKEMHMSAAIQRDLERLTLSRQSRQYRVGIASRH